MNQAQKIDLILENQIVIIDDILRKQSTKYEYDKDLVKQVAKTKEALAPQSDEMGCEEDLKDGGLKQ